MDTRYINHSRLRARGAVRPINLAIVVVLLVLAVAAWLLIIRPHQELVDAGSGVRASVSAPAAPRTSAVAANLAAMDLDQVLGEARKAANEGRFIAPAGNNAFEFYLAALQRQPGNPVATEALRETFPYAADAAEQSINSRDFNEAQREIDLLAKADPTNFTLTILRSKLDAERKTLDEQQQQQLDQQKQQQLAAQQTQTDATATQPVAIELAAARSTQTVQKTAAPVQPQSVPAARAVVAAPPPAAPPPAAPPAAPSGQTRGPILSQRELPRYPIQALRSGQQGWVDLAFTVARDGSVTDVSVLGAQPHHVFDSAAVEAVRRWKFSPALKDGQPVAAKLERRLEFKLGQ